MLYEERAHGRSAYGMASYDEESFNCTIKKLKEEWDALPSDKSEATLVASMAPSSSDRICFKFQTSECLRPNCPCIHKIMSEKERKEQKYTAKLPGEKNNFTSKNMKGNIGEKKIKGCSMTRDGIVC